MKLPRPSIPLKTRILVARRQVLEMPDTPFTMSFKPLIASVPIERINYSDWTLQILLAGLFGGVEAQLDHDPALVNRRYNIKTKKYMPDANDPDFLIYRTKAAHDIKTRVRGDGAQYSDLALRRKMKRIANKDRPVKKIPSRPFARRLHD